LERTSHASEPTGSYTLLSGIKNIPDIDISAIVAMTDTGGSTGVLRDELGVLPPGDVRQCLVALSEQQEVLRKLMSYRFEEGGLAGHSFGNLLLAGLEKVTGSFMEGVDIASDILKIKGKVIPVTESNATLHAILSNGSTLKGEDTINRAHFKDNTIKELYIDDTATINPRAQSALIDADYIIIAPGNHYCAILPNLIIPGFKDAVAKSNATVIYIPNLTNKKGQTLGWAVEDYVADIEKHLGNKVDIILANSEAPSDEQIEAYKLEEGDGVLAKVTSTDDPRLIHKPLISHKIIPNNPHDTIAHLRSFIRHDSEKLKNAIEEILDKNTPQ
jgi:uncharacterized cofD-like protein